MMSASHGVPSTITEGNEVDTNEIDNLECEDDATKKLRAYLSQSNTVETMFIIASSYMTCHRGPETKGKGAAFLMAPSRAL